MTGAPSGGGNGKQVPISPDGGWGWVVVVGSFFIHVFADGFVYSFGVMADHLMKEFNSDNATCAIIVSLLTGLTLGCGPLASAVCNKYGCRITTILGSIIAFIGCTMAYFGTAMWHMIFSIGVVMGLGFGLMYCPAIVIVTMYFESRRSLATGIAVAGAGVGTVLFSPVNSYLIREYGWRSVFLAFLGILVLCAICGATFRPLEFRAVEEIDLVEVKKTDNQEARAPENASLLIPDDKRLRTKSASSHTSEHGSLRLAKSLTHVSPDSDHSSNPRSRTGTLGEKESGYLNRKDVFYTASITNVAEFRDDPDKYRSTGSLHKKSLASASALSVGKLDQLRESSEENEDTSENVEGRNMFKTISKMLSLQLLVDPVFLLFAASNLLTSVGFNSPLYFLPLHAKNGLKLTEHQSAMSLTTFGILNTLGRVVFGIIGDRKLPLPNGWGDDTARNRLWIYNLSLSLCGILTTFSFLATNFEALCIYAGIFGFSISSYICLTSVILVDLLGLEKLTNAFGLLLLWQGVGTVFGPPIAGFLVDWTKTYTWAFVFCGVNLLISGVMLFAVPHYQRKKKLEEI